MSISNKPQKNLTGNKHIVFSEDKSIITIKHPDLPEFRLVKVEGGKGIIKKLNKKTKIADFYMAEYQVTQELYQAVTGNNPSRFKGKRRPVERVNWYDSIKFCQALNKKLFCKHKRLNPMPCITEDDRPRRIAKWYRDDGTEQN